MLSCEFLFLQKIQTLLGLHSAAQDNRVHTGRSSGSSLCLDAAVSSGFTLTTFHSKTSSKTFSTCCFQNILGTIVLSPSMYQILLHEIVPFIQQLVSINTKLYWNLEEVVPQTLPGLC